MSFGIFAFGEEPFGATATDRGGQGFATLPAITAVATGAAIAGGAGTATLPAITAAGSGGNVAQGNATASLPAITAAGTASTAVRGVLAASLPALRADIRITTGQRRRLRSWQQCPRPASGFAISGRVGTLRDGEDDA